MGKLRNTVLVLFILLLIGLAVVIYVVPGVTGMLVETYPAEYGELSIYDDTTGYFFRDEAVYATKDGGNVNRLFNEGDLLRPGTIVVDVTGGDQFSDNQNSGTTVTTDGGEMVNLDRITEINNKIESHTKKTSSYKIESGGIVSYFIDGYEFTLNPEKADSIKRDDLLDITEGQVVEITSSVRKGYPIFKIINNSGWQIVAYIPKEHRDQYEEGQSVDVTFFERQDNEENEHIDLTERDPLFKRVEMYVKAIKNEGDYCKLILRSSSFFAGIGQYRVAYCRIVSQDVSGLLIEKGSITEEDGKAGVYVKNKKGKYDFVPILVYGDNGKMVVVADTYFYDDEGEYTKTIDPFDDVLRKPRNLGEKE